MADEKIHVDAEFVPEGAEAILKEGGALVRIENMTQMTIAVQRPRKEAEIKKEALAELDMYPEAAHDAIYNKPVGKDYDTGKQKYAQGLSIRAAEALAYRWGNNAFAVEILGDDGMIVSGVAIFLDYERNARRAIPFRVSRKYRAKGGTMKIIPEDRFHDVVVPAKQSKALREVILRSLPPGLKKEYERKAKAIRSKEEKPERWGRLLRAFSNLGVDQKAIEGMMKKDVVAFTDDDYDEIQGVWNAIQDGETTVAQAFGKDVGDDAAEGPKAPVSVDAILGGGGGEFEEGRKPGAKPKEGDESKQGRFWKMIQAVSPDPEQADLLFDEIAKEVGSKAKDLKGLRGKKLDAALEELEKRIQE